MGLSKELRIVHLVLEQGYTSIAVLSMNRRNGCWSMSQDVPWIEFVLKHDLFQKHQHHGTNIFGIGASFKGAFAAKLATRKIV